MSEGHRERGRGAQEEGAARQEKGCRGGGRKVSRREAESRRKGLSVGGEQRPNRSGREGGWKEGGAGRSPGGQRMSTAPGTLQFLPLLLSRGPESPSQTQGFPKPAQPNLRSPATAAQAEKGGARVQRAEVAFTGDYFPITELFIRKVMWAFVYELIPHPIPPNLGSPTENIPLMLSLGSEKLFSNLSSVLSPTCEARA